MQSIVARFSTLGEAEAALSALDAAAIPSVLADDNVIAVQWLYANAVGWVKVLVPGKEHEDAAAVLASTATSEMDAVPEATAELQAQDVVMLCPACGRADVQRIPRFRIFCALSVVAVGLGVAVAQPALILAAVAAVGLIAAVMPSHRCRSCGERWTADDASERPVHAPLPTASDAADILCARCGSPEVHRVHYRRLASIALFAAPTLMVVVLPIWLLLPRWKCDSCGRRA
jgi:predicted RNA-binding Zn-ribbon protein involved in translation (DUF1610 family)